MPTTSTLAKLKTNPLENFTFKKTQDITISEGVVPALPFFIPQITDALAGGLRQGSINIVAANPGCGKSWFAFRQAKATAESKKNVLLISTELNESEVYARLVAMVTNIDIHHIDKITEHKFEFLKEIGRLLETTKFVTLEELQALNKKNHDCLKKFVYKPDAVERFTEMKLKWKNIHEHLFVIYDLEIETMFDKVAELSQLLAASPKNKLDMVIVDHCDFMRSKDKSLNLNEMARDHEFLVRLNELARRYNLCTFMVKQMSKPVKSLAEIIGSEADLLRGTRHWQYLASAIFLLLETKEQIELNSEMDNNIKQITLSLAKRRQMGSIRINPTTGVAFREEDLLDPKFDTSKIKWSYAKNHIVAYQQATGNLQHIKIASKEEKNTFFK
jgi:KaiC/GvpD/RAD55 family RecA-like ATPase